MIAKFQIRLVCLAKPNIPNGFLSGNYRLNINILYVLFLSIISPLMERVVASVDLADRRENSAVWY